MKMMMWKWMMMGYMMMMMERLQSMWMKDGDIGDDDGTYVENEEEDICDEEDDGIDDEGIYVDDGEEGALDISCNEGGEDGEDDIELYCWFCTFVVEC